MPLQAGCDLCDAICTLAEATLDCGAEMAAECAFRRCSHTFRDTEAQALDAIIDLDEGLSLLGDEEQRDVIVAQKVGSAAKQQNRAYLERCRARRTEAREAAATSEAQVPRARRGGRRTSATTAGSSAPVSRPLPANVWEQKALAPYTPPGGYIWRSNKTGAWCIHFKPFPRRTFAWALHGGHKVAGREALRALWRMHAQTTGDDHCPWVGLFETASVAAASSMAEVAAGSNSLVPAAPAVGAP